MSRITTSCASFSWARPAMRRACSSDVKTCTKCSRASWASIEPEGLNQLGNRRRHEAGDRLTVRDSCADVAGRDRQRFDLEELDSFRTRELCQHRVEPLARIPRTSGNPETRTRDHALGVLPGREVAK